MNVLVATDGSKYGRWGLNWVAKLPFVEPLRVTALHVLDIGVLRAPFLAQPVMAGNERYIQEEIQRMETRSAKILKEAKQQLASLKLKGAARKEQGAVAPVILKRAPKRDGLLVVGSQGLDALDRFMLGSKGGRPPIQVTVIHVMPFIKYPELKEAGRRMVEQGARKLVTAGFAAEALCQLGNPAEEIMKVASKHRADLIVMGAKGLGAIGRFLLGSVSTRVVQHSSCSVLVVR
jgi:nucleotide-binding universal stress UspA family protein